MAYEQFNAAWANQQGTPNRGPSGAQEYDEAYVRYQQAREATARAQAESDKDYVRRLSKRNALAETPDRPRQTDTSPSGFWEIAGAVSTLPGEAANQLGEYWGEAVSDAVSSVGAGRDKALGVTPANVTPAGGNATGQTDTEILSLKPSVPIRSTGEFGEPSFSGPGAAPFGSTAGQKYLRKGDRWIPNPDYQGRGTTVNDSDPVSFGALAGTEPSTGAFSVVGKDQFNNLMGFDAYKDSEGNLTSPAIREAELAALRRGESIDRSGPTSFTFGDYGDGSGSPIPKSSMQSPMQKEYSDLMSRYERGDISAKGMNAMTSAIRGKYANENLMALRQQGLDAEADENAQENYFAQQEAQQAQQGTFTEQTARWKAQQQAKHWDVLAKQAAQGLSLEQGRLLKGAMDSLMNAQLNGNEEGVMTAFRSIHTISPKLAMEMTSGNPDMAGAFGGKEARIAANPL